MPCSEIRTLQAIDFLDFALQWQPGVLVDVFKLLVYDGLIELNDVGLQSC